MFEIANGVRDEDLHPKFLLLKNEAFLSGERAILNRWVSGFQDRDNKLKKEFQTTFHSTLWELYLFQVFKEMGCDIDWEKNRPDFMVKSPIVVNFEAVVSEIKQGGRPESKRTFDDVYSMTEPPWEDPHYEDLMAEAITRYSNSITGKRNKYVEQYSRLSWVSEEDPFVIASSSYAQVRYGKEYHYPMVALLYGYYFDPESKQYTKRNEIIKPGTDSSIPLGIFDNKMMTSVSAVVFSCTVTLGKLAAMALSDKMLSHPTNFVFLVRHDYDPPHYKIQEVSPESPEDLFDGLFVFHNPNATNKLPKSLFEPTSAIQVSADSDGLYFEGGNLPLVTRLNISKLQLPGNYRRLFMQDVFNRFNAN